jgi:hypothetical protein
VDEKTSKVVKESFILEGDVLCYTKKNAGLEGGWVRSVRCE